MGVFRMKPATDFLVVLGSPGRPILKSRHAKKRAGEHRPASVRWNVGLNSLRRDYWVTTVINHRTGVQELSSRTDRTTPFTVDRPNVSFAT
jgi:hypothetical protein